MPKSMRPIIKYIFFNWLQNKFAGSVPAAAIDLHKTEPGLSFIHLSNQNQAFGSSRNESDFCHLCELHSFNLVEQCPII